MPENPVGHFESIPVCRLNDRVLHASDSSWLDCRRIGEPAQEALFARFGDEAAALIVSEFGKNEPFVLKDPRICRLLPFWLRVFEDAGVTAKIVVPVRSPSEVAASLASRNDYHTDFGRMLWLHNVLAAELASRETARVFTTYDGLLTDWRNEMARIAQTLDLALPEADGETANAVDGFLDRTLRHHDRQTQGGSASGSPPMRRVQKAHRILNAWARSKENASDFHKLDRIRASFQAEIEPFNDCLVSGQAARHRAMKLSERLGENRREPEG